MQTTTRFPKSSPITILLADDDPDDRLLLRDALTETGAVFDLRCVNDGEELLDYLLGRNSYAEPERAPAPGLILLDLNMPRKDGREALHDIKTNPLLRSIPVIVLTTSKSEDDILRSYSSGVNSYIAKPSTFDGLVGIMQIVGRYWLQTAELPTRG